MSRLSESVKAGEKVEIRDEKMVLAENEALWLTKPSLEQMDHYVQVMKENSTNKAGYDSDEYKEHLWKELNRESGLYCSIIRKADDAFCGYCGIEDIEENIWEVSIELLKRYHRQGLGYQALSLMMNMLKEKKGVCEFKSRVEGLNIASQKLMEKANGTLVGVEQEDGVQILVYHHKI